MSSDEGLDPVDGPDVEVPTATHKCPKCRCESKPVQKNNGYWGCSVCGYGSDYDKQLEKKDFQQIWREDHREALREAVQHGAERERRRILNKIQEIIDRDSDRYAKKSMPNEFLARKNVLEELEEEVETDKPMPKTGKSDNFGETEQ